jgi:N-acetylmuramoyl-L-alanine amidase
VACVVLNRVRVADRHGGKYWWGNNIISVCQKPYQFSCWNRTDPVYKKLQAVTEKSDIYFATCLRIARRAVAGTLADVSGGATHYHRHDVYPDWSRGVRPIKIIGNHHFFNLVEV